MSSADINAVEMLTIERKRADYIMPTSARPVELYEKFADYFDKVWREEKKTRMYETIKGHYGLLFVFECGRIFGIRMERARRRKGAAHAEI